MSVLDLLMPNDDASRPMRLICGTVARGTDVVAGVPMEREVAKTPEVVKPLHTGATGVLWRAAGILSATSLVLNVAPTKRSLIRIVRRRPEFSGRRVGAIRCTTRVFDPHVIRGLRLRISGMAPPDRFRQSFVFSSERGLGFEATHHPECTGHQ